MTQSEDYKRGYQDALADIRSEIEKRIAETEKVSESLLASYNPIIGQRFASKQHNMKLGLVVAKMIIEKKSEEKQEKT